MSIDLVDKLIECFPKPSSAMITEMDRVAQSIPEKDRQLVFDTILDEAKASMKIGVKDIKDACRKAGVSFTQPVYIASMPIQCDCCGEDYKYHPAPTDDQQIDLDIHDRCPNCGFQRCWTLMYRASVTLGHVPEWYESYLQKFANGNYGKGKPQGVWFNKSKRLKERYTADQEERQARDELDARVKQLRGNMRI